MMPALTKTREYSFSLCPHYPHQFLFAQLPGSAHSEDTPTRRSDADAHLVGPT